MYTNVGGWKYLGTGKTFNLPTEPFTELFVWQGREGAPTSVSSTFVYTVPKVIIPSTGSIIIENGYAQNSSSMTRMYISITATSITAGNYSSSNSQVAVYYR